MSFKTRKSFKNHIAQKAAEQGVSVGAYIKAGMAKVSKYKEQKKVIQF